MNTSRTRLLGVTALGLVVTLVPVGSLAVQAPLTQDAYISTGRPGGNFGKSRSLNVTSGDASTFVLFDLSTLPSGTTGADVARATLRLWTNRVSGAAAFDVLRVTGAWNESSITAGSAPSIGTTAASGVPVTVANQFVTVDVTAVVQEWLNLVLVNNGLALQGSGSLNAVFDSKENNRTAHEPTLEITLAGIHSADIANTFAGVFSGASLTTGTSNTGLGSGALYLNTTGDSNTAVGASALQSNINGFANVAVGVSALVGNTGGSFNTALGTVALSGNSTGVQNTAVGYLSLNANTTGDVNTAVGSTALYQNTTGGFNTALGVTALGLNTTGDSNTGLGTTALTNNTTGSGNTAVGSAALQSNTSGDGNIAIGYLAGINLTTGSGNIDIGSNGVTGESSTIRIGNGQTRAFVAGIRAVTTGVADAVSVMIDSNGQLGTISSARRFKEAIHDMGEASDGLMKLRPVTFRYKPDLDPSGTRQYGLIAEEVADVVPDLVVYDAEGRPETVRYHLLAAMLLNEAQKQARQNDTLRQEVATQRGQLAEQTRQLEEQVRQIEKLTAQTRQVSAQARQIEALMTRLSRVEAGLDTSGHASATEASHRMGPNL